jgi:CheY-like chemotaxis protein
VGKRILVVDDDERILFVLEHALLSLAPDTEVITATNAAQALEQVSEVRVDLVLTDLRMPGQDGISLTSDLRLLIPTTPVIWVTAHHGPAVSEEARRLGVFGCLTKPADLAEIRAMAVGRWSRAWGCIRRRRTRERGSTPHHERRRRRDHNRRSRRSCMGSDHEGALRRALVTAQRLSALVTAQPTRRRGDKMSSILKVSAQSRSTAVAGRSQASSVRVDAPRFKPLGQGQ